MIGMLTGTAPDCRPLYVSCSSTIGWSETTVKLCGSGGWWQGKVGKVNFDLASVFLRLIIEENISGTFQSPDIFSVATSFLP
jgi:hypothetical protein